MSRALDKDLYTQLKSEDPRPVYTDISTVLNDLPDTGLLEIELLGKSHPLEPGLNYLKDGTAVAIPKLRLVQAFFVAREILQNSAKDSTTQPISRDVIRASAVVLLMDPEHLTAANTRKRAIMYMMENGKLDQHKLKHEKQFVDMLLTARLHRHTKSPTLWSHRRWLLQTCMAQNMAVDAGLDITQVVMVAGERHPRNYTAWQHARLLTEWDRRGVGDIVISVKEFCLRNHDDISAWDFLSFVIRKIDGEEQRREVCLSLLSDILHIADSFLWTNESVWCFLRTIVATELVSEQQFESFMALYQKLSSTTPQHSPQRSILDRARQWCDKYRLHHVSDREIGIRSDLPQTPNP
ncbi:hypothetical protein F5X96DRAFT_647810 [Biscogniauxia mediterranea]|nr:hypothetical protein F5X96DRAFT_647810 [Biscogniauxia mediterranea]